MSRSMLLALTLAAGCLSANLAHARPVTDDCGGVIHSRVADDCGGVIHSRVTDDCGGVIHSRFADDCGGVIHSRS